MRGCSSKSLKHWDRWLSQYTDEYLTVEPVDGTYFHDSDRTSYWEKFISILDKKDALIFVDPDTGLETGSLSYQKKMGRDKYLLNSELRHIVETMDTSAVLMIYQHLPRNKKIHLDSVRKKMKQISDAVGGLPVCAFREDDLAFLFISKSQSRHAEVSKILNQYHEKSAVTHKSVHSANYF